MSPDFEDTLKRIRRTHRSIATRARTGALTVQAAVAGPAGAALSQQIHASSEEHRKIADLADQWVRDGYEPTHDEWKTFAMRVHRQTALAAAFLDEVTAAVQRRRP